MHENPYKPLDIPEEDDVVIAVKGSIDLRKLASRQRQVLFSLLFSILIVVASLAMNAMAVQGQLSESVRDILGIAMMVLAILSLVCAIWRLVATFLLAKILYSTVSAIFWTLGNLIPLIGFIILVILNQKAISRLQQHGVKVGFMGVNPNKINQTLTTELA